MVCVVEDGEFLPELLEVVGVDCDSEGLLCVIVGSGECAAVGIDEGGATAVVALLVVADAVDAGNEALVFECSGTEQGVPYGAAAVGPVGYIDGEVVVATVAREDGETEVVAYLQEYAQLFPLYYDALLPGGVVVVLASAGEEVVLVVDGDGAVGGDEIEAVADGASGEGDGNGAGNGGGEL